MRTMRLRLVALLCILLPPAFGHAQASTAPPAANTIVCWQEGRPLEWEDFQAKARPFIAKADSLPGTFLGANTEANAVIYEVTENANNAGVVVSVEFDKTKSWANKTAEMDISYTVAHEQLHFDIVELTARKLRQALAPYTASKNRSTNPKLMAALSCIYEEEDNLQALYDEDTYAGNDIHQQARWTVLVHHSLKQLAKYKSTPADCIQP